MPTRTAAAKRDAVDGKDHFVHYDVIFTEEAATVRRLDSLDLPAHRS